MSVFWREELHPRGEGGKFTFSYRQDEPLALEYKSTLERDVNGATYKEYRNSSAANRAYASGDLHDGLLDFSGVEREALDTFTDEGEGWNQWLRRGGQVENIVGSYGGIIDNMLAKSKLSQNLVVYRKIDPNSAFGLALEHMKLGYAFRDKGFMSTSIGQLDAPENVIRIYAPQGSHAIVTGAHESFGADDHEVIFARNTRLTYAGKGADNAHEFLLDQAAEVGAHELDPETVEVGGDEWNRRAAVRLEAEYASVKPELEKLADELVTGKKAEEPELEVEAEEPEEPDLSDLPVVPEEWDMMSTDQQEQALQEYKNKTYESYYQDQVDNWSSEQAPDEARLKVAEDFTDGSETEWAKEALALWREEREDGAPRVPYTDEQLLSALTITHDTGHYPIDKGTDIDWDDSALQRPDTYVEGQLLLPGIEKIDLSESLTSDMRKEIMEYIKPAFVKAASDVENDLDPPEYLSEEIAEFQEESWESMDDKEKFHWVEGSTMIIEDAQKEYDEAYEEATGDKLEGKAPSIPREIKLPSKFDPLNETSGEDYRRTQVLSRELSIARAAQLAKQRNIEVGKERLRSMDNTLWESWKSSSHSDEGKLLQAAIAEELGGRLRSAGDNGVDHAEAVSTATRRFGENGFEKAKALVRAKWETTQYLLDKADKDKLELYRAINLSDIEGRPAEEREIVNVSGFKKLPKLPIDRNGAASTSLDDHVSNNWRDDSTRVVLRIRVPRTAAVSVPSYGQNYHKEHEVIIAGVGWQSWDAWRKTAPRFSEVPL